MRPMECATVHAVVSSAHGMVSTVHAMDGRMGRGTEGLVQGMLDVGLGGLLQRNVAKSGKNRPKSEGEKGSFTRASRCETAR